MAKQATYCKKCGKELSFISKRFHNGFCTGCFVEEAKPHCKECGKELEAKTYGDMCPECILEENKRHKGYCKACGRS
jgi:NMD protein affecting ribosome stability and mRNA decay